jgi:hypothetical protein
VHYAGPIIFTPLSLFLVCGGAIHPIFLLPPLAALYGCYVSILIGFPIAAIMLFFVDPPSSPYGKEESMPHAPENFT